MAVLPLKSPGEGSSLPLLASGGSRLFLACGSIGHSDLCLHRHTAVFPLCLFVSRFFSSYKDTCYKDTCYTEDDEVCAVAPSELSLEYW